MRKIATILTLLSFTIILINGVSAVNINDWQNSKKLNISDYPGQPTIDKAQPVYLGNGKVPESGKGEIKLDWSGIQGSEDIAFFDENGDLLNYEIESLNISNKSGLVWVRNNWTRDGTTQSYIAYGNGDKDYQDVENTWPSDAAIVQHLNGNAKDSTQNNNNGDIIGTGNTSAAINGGKYFDGKDDRISISDSSEINFADGASHTLSVWFKRDGYPNSGKQEYLYRKGDDTGFFKMYFSHGNSTNELGRTNSKEFSIGVRSPISKNVDSIVWNPSSYNLTDNKWHRITYIYSNQGNSIRKIYFDGDSSPDPDFRKNEGPGTIGGGGTLSLGSLNYDYRGKRLYNNGGIDEFKIYRGVEKSEDWIKAGYDASRPGNQTFFIQEENSQPEWNYSLNETVFTGSGKNMLKAISLNGTVFVSDNNDILTEEFDSLNKFNTDLRSPNKVFERNSYYYVDSRDKAVYVAALAAKNNSSLTFDQRKATKDFSDTSISELKSRFVEEFNPHHIVLVDLDSKKGVLASYMAVKEDVLPVDADSVSSAEELQEKVKDEFSDIGSNRRTIFEGRFISVLDAPAFNYSDPVDKGVFKDPEDGNSFESYLEYGNLDQDQELEASVGVYPENLSLSSVLFQRSVEREKGEEALVGSEYLHSEWPVVLATLGGGMFTGKSAEEILEKEGFETTRLAEHRSEPAKFLFDVVGVPSFISGMNKAQTQLSTIVSDTAGRAFKNGMIVIRGLEFAERTLKIYLEFEWDEYVQEFNPDLPETASFQEFEQFIFSVLPDRHPELTSNSLKSEMETADVVYYSGVGNSTEWTMPNKPDNIEVDAYTGENSFTSEDIPKMDNSIVWDSSNNGGTENAELKDGFLESGASNYIGFSGVSYHSYTSHIGLKFLKYGDTVGGSLNEGINSLRDAFLVYNPASSFKTGVREKMTKSATLYGNPETVKDPIPKDRVNKTKECGENYCQLRIKVDPSPEVVKSSSRKTLKFNTSNHILRPFKPVIPVFIANSDIPADAEIKSSNIESEYRNVRNISVRSLKPISHGSRFRNHSLDTDRFPERTSRVNISDRLEYVQAGIQRTDNGYRVLEGSELLLNYSSPYGLEIKKKRNILKAEIKAEESVDGELAFSIDGNRSVKSVDVDSDSTVELANISKGNHRVEAYLYEEDVLAFDKKKVENRAALKTYLFGSDVSKGEIRQVKLVVKNPGSHKVKKSFSLDTDDNTGLDILESKSKSVVVPSKDERVITWSVLGLKQGESKISGGGKSVNLTVSEAAVSDSVLSPEKYLSSFGSTSTEIEREVSSDTVSVKVTKSNIELYLERNRSGRYSRLETSEFIAETYSSYKVRKKSVRTSKGGYIVKDSSGVTKSRSSGLGEDVFLEKAGVLAKESEKFEMLLGNS